MYVESLTLRDSDSAQRQMLADGANTVFHNQTKQLYEFYCIIMIATVLAWISSMQKTDLGASSSLV